MGTRGLTAVMFGGEYRIAQYGQWDHYPGGQGIVALDFCRTWLTDPVKESQFVSNMMACRWISIEEIRQTYRDVGADGSGLVTLKQAEAFLQIYPLINRDLGADVLFIIAERGPGALQNSIEFAGDSLFCEYAYVIDLDKRTFEVYRGFNEQPLDESERFAKIARTKNNYHQVRHVATFSLDNLPSNSVFLEVTKKNEDECAT